MESGDVPDVSNTDMQQEPQSDSTHPCSKESETKIVNTVGEKTWNKGSKRHQKFTIKTSARGC